MVSSEVSLSREHGWKVLDNDVYARVFDEMLEEIDSELLNDNDVKSYTALSLPSRYLITRLSLRAQKWIRRSALEKYLCEEQLTATIRELENSRWILNEPSLEDLLSASSVKELQDAACHFGLRFAEASRNDLRAMLSKFSNQRSFFSGPMDSKVFSKLRAQVAPCYKLADDRRLFLEKLQCLFLAPTQGATIETILRSRMGLIRFFSFEYARQKDAPIFPGKMQYDEYFEARKVCDPIEAWKSVDDPTANLVLQNQSQLKESKRVANVRFTANYVYGRAIYLISCHLGKAHRFDEEYVWIGHYLKQCAHVAKRGQVLIRKLHLELKQHVETRTKAETSWLKLAVNTYLDASGELTEAETLDMNRKAVRLMRELKKAGLCCPFTMPESKCILPEIVIQAEQRKSLSVKTQWGSDELAARSVEEAALDHYVDKGWTGGHYENSMIRTIFWLILYDLMFDDPSYLRCRYQTVPLKLQDMLDKHKKEIFARFQNASYESVCHAYRQLKTDEPFPLIGGIDWRISCDDIGSVIRCFGPKLSPILSRLAQDYKQYCSGFSDLLLWNLETSEVKVVEVKSENDTLSDSQRIWIEFMLRASVDVEICRVISSKSSSLKRRKAGNCEPEVSHYSTKAEA